MDDNTIHVLLIEDNDEHVQVVQEALSKTKGTRFALECADYLSTGLKSLAERSSACDSAVRKVHTSTIKCCTG